MSKSFIFKALLSATFAIGGLIGMTNAMAQPYGNNGDHNRGRDTSFDCQSQKGGYRECDTGIRGGVKLVQVLSDSACVEGRSWGQRPGTVWVTRGCRATFASMGRPGPRDDRWNSGYGITCTSNRHNRGECEWDRRYGSPRLAETYSRNSCVEGSTWGYQPRQGILWVSGGCRARFVTTRSSFGR